MKTKYSCRIYGQNHVNNTRRELCKIGIKFTERLFFCEFWGTEFVAFPNTTKTRREVNKIFYDI